VAKSTSIVLNDRWEKFLTERIATGRYDSVSEAVRAGLRLLEIEEEKFDRLMALLQEGIDSGPATPFDMDEIIREAKAKVKRAA
jgi:antitoxin ParD1/3/4